MNTNNKKALIAMSGGVDSAVAALLLKKEGYDVGGITMKLWSDTEKVCDEEITAPDENITEAKKIADILGIPHYSLALGDCFHRCVIDRFISDYAEGKTPNPCVECNKHLKFGKLFEETFKRGYDLLATGHYARIEQDESGRYLLKKAVDEGKTSLAGVSADDFAIVKEARTCKSTLGGHVAFIPENSDAKDLAKDFLTFMASDKGIETFMKATRGVSTAFKYQMDYESDLFKGFSPLQQQRIKDTSVDDWYVGKGYRTPLTRSGALSDVCTENGQKQLEIEFCSQSSADRRRAKTIAEAIYNRCAANDQAVWKSMLSFAGVTD
jgi:hypothetical protein